MNSRTTPTITFQTNQALPQTSSKPADNKLFEGGCTTEGKMGPYRFVPDVTSESAQQYQCGPGTCELRVAGTGVIAAVPCFVLFDTDGIAQLPSAGGAYSGIAVANDPPGTNTVRVVLATDTVGYVKAGAALANGAKLKTDATGRALTSTAATQLTGYALKAAAALGDIIPVRMARGLMP